MRTVVFYKFKHSTPRKQNSQKDKNKKMSLTEWIQSLRHDFKDNFLKFLVTMMLLAVVVPLGIALVTMPVLAILAILMPLLVTMTFALGPLFLLIGIVASFHYSSEIERLKNILHSYGCALAYGGLCILHPLFTQIIKITSKKGSTPSPELRALGAIIKLTRQRGKTYTLEMFRKTCQGYAILFWYKKAIHRDVWNVRAVDPVREIPCHYLRTALCPDASPSTIFYLHGGGFIAGSASVYRGMIAPLATQLNCNVFAVEYRKMPEYPLPAAVNDAVAAYKYLIVTTGLSPERIIFAGDSAGGSLCLLTLIALKEEGMPLPAGALLMSPYVDLTVSSDSWIRNRGKDFILEPRIIDAARSMFTESPTFTVEDAAKFSPALFPSSRLADLPPLFISAGTYEPLIDEVNSFVENLKEAGVPHEYVVKESCPHVFQMFYNFCPEARETMDKGILFMDNCLSRKARS